MKAAATVLVTLIVISGLTTFGLTATKLTNNNPSPIAPIKGGSLGFDPLNGLLLAK